MKKYVNAFDYAAEICKALPGGILLTTKAGEKVNTMTIGWGTIGIEWGKPIFRLSALISKPQNIVSASDSD